jgi:hypothetical protein
MTVKDYLISTHGLSAEEAAVIADNPKYAGVYEKAMKEAEEGKTALLRANETKSALEKWNQEQVIPYVQKADRAVADAEAKIAAQSTYLKTLKAQGYEIPDAYLDGSAPTSIPAKPAAAEPPVKNDDMLNYAKANMALIAMSNRYRKLVGDELDPEREYEDFTANARPNENLRSYIDRKYDLSSKEAAKDAEKKAAYEKKIADDAVTAAKAEWQKSHGTNPETIVPRSSRFDRVTEDRKSNGVDSTGRPLWQTAAGREEATKKRLEKYAGLVH